MNEATNHGLQNSPSRLSDPSNCSKTVQVIMTEAQEALDQSNKLGIAYNIWFSNSEHQIRHQGCLACWKEGLILTMQVCQASLLTHASVEASFLECNDLLKCNRSAQALLADAGSNTEVIDLAISEAETTACRLADALSKESLRFDRFSETWDQLAATIANWYNLHPSVLWELPTYMPPGMFEDGQEDDGSYDDFDAQ